MKPLRFHWVRHATPLNPDDVCYGAEMDVDLSNRRDLQKQALRLPEDALWLSSSMPRAILTAQALAGHHPDRERVALQIEDDLREQSFGSWAGLPRASLPLRPDFQAYRSDPENIPPPGGESLKDLALRVGYCNDRLIAAHPQGGDIVLVAHKGTIRAAIHHATSIRLQDIFKLSIDPLSVTVLRYDSRKWTLESMNMKV